MIRLDHSPTLSSLVARLLPSRLDRQLAAGVDPWRSSLHAARSLQLTRNRSRRTLARCLDRLIEQAEETPTAYLNAVVAPDRPRVHEARPELFALAFRLRGPQPLNVRGVVTLRELLGDGAGPCYTRGDPDMLKLILQAIDESLDVED